MRSNRSTSNFCISSKLTAQVRNGDREILAGADRHLQIRLGALLSQPPKKRGRTGFDCWFETQAACRGSLVGLVKLSGQNITANNVVEADFSSEELALAA